MGNENGKIKSKESKDYYKSGDYQKALDAARSAQAESFDSPLERAEAIVNEANALRALKQYRKAAERYETAFKHEAFKDGANKSERAQIASSLALTYSEMGLDHYQDAINYAFQADDTPDTKLNALQTQDQFLQRVIRTYSEYRQLFPRDTSHYDAQQQAAYLLNLLSYHFLTMDRFEQAEACADQANTRAHSDSFEKARADENLTRISYARSRLLAAKHPDDAKHLRDKLIQRHKDIIENDKSWGGFTSDAYRRDRARMLDMLSQIFEDQGDTVSTAKMTERSMATCASFMPAYIRRGTRHLLANQLREALADLNTGIDRIDGSDLLFFIPAYFRRALCFYTLGQREEAIRDCQTAIQCYANNPTIPYIKALLAFLTDASEMGHAALIDLKPFQERPTPVLLPAVHIAQGLAQAATHDFSNAIINLTDRSTNPSAYLYCSRAETRYSSGQNDINSIQDCLEALNLISKGPSLAFHLLEKAVERLSSTEEGFYRLAQFCDRDRGAGSPAQPLLHIACIRGYEPLVNRLLAAAERYHTIPLLVLSRRHTDQRTAIDLAIENDQVSIAKLLVTPLIRLRLARKVNEPLNLPLIREAARAEREHRPQTEVKIGKEHPHEPTPHEIARDFTENGMTQENSARVHGLFSNEETCQKIIAEYEARKKEAEKKHQELSTQACEEATAFVMAKLKYASEHPTEAPGTERAHTSTDDKGTSEHKDDPNSVDPAIDPLMSSIRSGLIKRLQSYLPFPDLFNDLLLFLQLLRGARHGESFVASLERFVAAQPKGSTYQTLILSAFELLQLFRKSDEGLSCRSPLVAIAHISQIWADRFGGIEEQEFTRGLVDLAEQYSREQSFSLEEAIHNLSEHYQSPGTQCASELIYSMTTPQATIAEQTEMVAKLVREQNIPQARSAMSTLLYGIIKKRYEEADQKQLQAVVAEQIGALDLTPLTEQPTHRRCRPFVQAFSAISKAMPNPTLAEASEILFGFLSDAEAASHYAKVGHYFLAAQLLARFFIAYGERTENRSLSYAGLFGLIACRLYFLSAEIRRAPDALEDRSPFDQAAFVIRAIGNILGDASLVFQNYPSLVRLQAGAGIIVMILGIIDKAIAHPPETALGYLTLARQGFQDGLIEMARVDARNEDRVVRIIKTCLEISNEILIVGDILRSAYEFLRSNPISTALNCLTRVLPDSVASSITVSLLGGLPVVGSVISSQLIQDSIKRSQKSIEEHIDHMEHRVLGELHKMEGRLSTFMNMGIEQTLLTRRAMEYRLDAIEAELVTMKKMLEEIRGATSELPVSAQIRTFARELSADTQSAVGLYQKRLTAHLPKRFHKLCSSLSSLGNDSISTYNKYVTGWELHAFDLAPRQFREQLGFLDHHIRQTEEEIESVPGINPIRHYMPNFPLWSESMSALITFLQHADTHILLDPCFTPQREGFDFYLLCGVQNSKDHEGLIRSTIALADFLSSLRSERVIKAMFESVLRKKTIEPSDIWILANFFALIGMPLSEVGVNESLWLVSSLNGDRFRRMMLEIVLDNHAFIRDSDTLQMERHVRILGVRLADHTLRLLNRYCDRYAMDPKLSPSVHQCRESLDRILQKDRPYLEAGLGAPVEMLPDSDCLNDSEPSEPQSEVDPDEKSPSPKQVDEHSELPDLFDDCLDDCLSDDGYQTHTNRPELPPEELPIPRLAFTGFHYLPDVTDSEVKETPSCPREVTENRDDSLRTSAVSIQRWWRALQLARYGQSTHLMEVEKTERLLQPTKK